MLTLKHAFILSLGCLSLAGLGCSQAETSGRTASVSARGSDKSSNPDSDKSDEPSSRGGEDEGDSTVAVDTGGKQIPLDPKMRQANGPDTFSAKSVVYGSGSEGSLKGFYLRPGNNLSLKPAVLAVHGRTGLNDDFKKMLQWFVGAGYPVLAVDLYNGMVPESFDKSDEAESAANGRGEVETLANIISGAKYLFDSANASAVIIVGWDRGGKWAIEAALAAPERFVGIVNYYGSLAALESQPKKLERPLFNVQLASDRDIPWATVEAVQKKLVGAGKEVTLRKVENATAGFMEPSRNPDFFAGLLNQTEGQTPAEPVAVLKETVSWMTQLLQAKPAAK